MAKKSSKAKEVVVEDKNVVLQRICEDLRKAKIALKQITAEEAKYKKLMYDFAIENKLESGSIFGIKIMPKYSFLPSNIEVAKKNGIEIPEDISFSLKLSESRIKDLIDQGILKEDEVEKNAIPDFKALEKIFQEKQIEGEYGLSYAFGISE
jgi:hypothetical protein